MLPDYRIHIGARATLLPAASSRAFGILMELSDRELALTGANPTYAGELSRLVEALGFESAYAEEIAAFAKPS